MQDRMDNPMNFNNQGREKATVAGGLLGNIDIMRILKLLIYKAWAMLLVGVIVGSCVFLYAKATYVKSYSTTATLAFTTKNYVTLTDENGNVISITETVSHYTKSDASRYQFFLKTDLMCEKIAAALGGEYSVNTIRNAISVKSASESGIFDISVKSINKDLCANAIVVIINEFPGYLQRFDSSLGIEVLIRPSTPVVTNADDAMKNAIVGFLAGAILVAAAVVAIDLFSKTVKGGDDVRTKVNARLLGIIPLIEIATGAMKKKKMPKNGILITDESSVTFNFVESFKAIRTKIENLSADKGSKVFAITSTFEDEGKTTVSTNIACALAQKGKSVLLIDCDLRKPAVMNTIGVKDDKQVGMIPIIRGKSTYMDSIKFIKSIGVFVMPTGGITTKSTEILDSKKVKEVFEQARAEFDYIIVDTPPTHVVSDSLVLGDVIDEVVFVVRNDYAKINDINETLEELYGADVDVAGIVLTMAEDSGSNKYYKRKGYRYRRYGKYGYNSKYGYGSKYGGYGSGSSYGYGSGSSYGYGFGYCYGAGYGYGADKDGYGYGADKDGYGYGYGYGYGTRNRHQNVERADEEMLRQIENSVSEIRKDDGGKIPKSDK